VTNVASAEFILQLYRTKVFKMNRVCIATESRLLRDRIATESEPVGEGHSYRPLSDCIDAECDSIATLQKVARGQTV
jgi:hypothetical protein